VALMLALGALSPFERAAFLLHDVFEMEFAQVAGTPRPRRGRLPAARGSCSRHVRSARPRFAVKPTRARLAGPSGGGAEAVTRVLGRPLAADASCA
jgi:RNA polymerase sigma-70 factor (ECF subfamily)